MSDPVNNPMGAGVSPSPEIQDEEANEKAGHDNDLDNIEGVQEVEEVDLPDEEGEEPRSKGIVDQVIAVWKVVKSKIKAAYAHSKVPQALVPARDRAKEWLDDRFECTRNGSTVETEIFAGVLNFFSCMYILAVIPVQMATAGYSAEKSAAVISLLTGFSSIACGLVTNLPLVTAPATAVSIYYVSNIRQFNLSTHEGNLAVSYAGVIIILLGIIGPLGRLISKLIPAYIQYSISIGIGLMTALSGMAEINLVVRGRYTLLAVGTITNEIVIAISGLILISIGVYYHSKISYVTGMLWGTVIWWSYAHQWPVVWAEAPAIDTDGLGPTNNGDAILLIFEIFLLILLSLFGLAKALCDLAEISPTDESIPRGRLLMVVIGVSNLIAGMFAGPPIIISPECSSGIKAGSKTGLSSVVAGVMFIFSVFFAPLFSAIPPAGTTPVLIMIGMLLFQNISHIDFGSKYGMPAFLCLTIIPFTDSIIGGIVFAYVTYTVIAILTGDFTKQCQLFLKYYCSGAAEEEVTSTDGAFEGPALALTGVPSSNALTKRRTKSNVHSQSMHGDTVHSPANSPGGRRAGAGVVQSEHGPRSGRSPSHPPPPSRGRSTKDVHRDRSGSNNSAGSGGGEAAAAHGHASPPPTDTAAVTSTAPGSANSGETRGRALTLDGTKKAVRRASAAFITSLTQETNFSNDFAPTVTQFDHEV